MTKKKLTDEEIAKITAKPKGEFRPTKTAETIIARVQAEKDDLIDEISLQEMQSWSELSGQVVGAEVPWR